MLLEWSRTLNPDTGTGVAADSDRSHSVRNVLASHVGSPRTPPTSSARRGTQVGRTSRCSRGGPHHGAHRVHRVTSNVHRWVELGERNVSLTNIGRAQRQCRGRAAGSA